MNVGAFFKSFVQSSPAFVEDRTSTAIQAQAAPAIDIADRASFTQASPVKPMASRSKKPARSVAGQAEASFETKFNLLDNLYDRGAIGFAEFQAAGRKLLRSAVAETRTPLEPKFYLLDHLYDRGAINFAEFQAAGRDLARSALA